MATGNKKCNAAVPEPSAAGDAVRALIVEHATGALTNKINRKAAKLAEKAAHHVDAMRVGGPSDARDVWTRAEPGRRQPKLSRSNIAQTAIAIADAEGFDAVSMRRIATELNVGTMSLYHYVRTKDELLMVVVDEFLGEVILPPSARLPNDWRAAITIVAQRTRDALRRHPWILDISDDPNFGPNAIRHFDQSWQSLNSLDATLEFKIDVVMTVDEYVFGHCLHERNHFTEGDHHSGMVEYLQQLLGEGEYPAIDALVESEGIDTFFTTMHDHARDYGRFDRNLARLLSGFALALSS